jgi:hypothetical protein
MVNSGLLKINKKNPIKSAVLKTPPKLSGAIFVYGRIKSGKTVSLLTLAGMYHDNPHRKYKIFDLWGGDRNEHLYWTLPSNSTNYWNYAKKILNLSEPGPKQYQVNLLYPLLKNKIYKKLPQNPPYVFSKAFTIPIQDVELEDIALVIGPISERSTGRWKKVKTEFKKNETINDFLYKYKKEGGEKDLLYTNFLLPLSQNFLLQDNNSVLNIDISKEIREQEIISVLSLDYVDKEYKIFILGYLIRKICEDLDKRSRKVVGLVREASEFFRVTDQSVVHDRLKILRGMMSQWIRMGRRGFHLLLDTQSPSETRGLVDGQQDLTMYGRLPGASDRETATKQLKQDGLITSKQISQLAINEPGQFMVCPSARPAYYKYVTLPRCRFWEEGNGNFYTNVWAKESDKWVNYKDEINAFEKRFKENEEQMKERVSKEKEKKKDKKEYKPQIVNIRKEVDYDDDIDDDLDLFDEISL